MTGWRFYPFGNPRSGVLVAPNGAASVGVFYTPAEAKALARGSKARASG